MANVQPIPQTSPSIQIPTTIDYTSRDYMGMMNSLLIYASQAFPDWSPQSQGDIGVMLLELFAYIGDINSYYTDRVMQEAYLPTATQRQSLLNIAGLLGYVPSNGTPATGTVTFQTDNPGSAVVIPEGTVVQSNFNTDTINLSEQSDTCKRRHESTDFAVQSHRERRYDQSRNPAYSESHHSGEYLACDSRFGCVRFG